MFDKLKTMFNKKQAEQKNAKEIATEAGEPYIKVLDTNVDPKNPKYGYFELDWNEHFVNNLKTHGFSGNTDEEVVDHWFSVLCNTIATEETPMANDNQIIKETKREDGKTEIS
tara:strand:+ start:161 stop:499 length:339 start_codon:yes stop_codon:yes gene_type:complete